MVPDAVSCSGTEEHGVLHPVRPYSPWEVLLDAFVFFVAFSHGTKSEKERKNVLWRMYK